MGGVGKTALATVLAHRLKDRYPDAQLYLNLRGADPGHRPPVPPVEAMQNIIHVFQPEARLPDTLDQLTPCYHSVLNDAGRVLLLLDNAADADQIRPLLPPPNCLLLVTSRAQFQLPGLATRNIDCLAPARSQELLLKLAPRLKGHEAEAAELCGHLPLALEVFAGVVNDKRLYPVKELLERLRTRTDKLTAVAAAFEVSYELLAEDLRRRWRLLAVFSTSFDLPAAAVVWDEGRAGSPLPAADGTQADERRARSDAPYQQMLDSVRDAMQALVSASLVEWNETNNRFHLHDLVRQFCEGKLSEDERTAARLRHAWYYCAVGVAADGLYLQGGQNMVCGLELFDRERTHLEAAFEFLFEEVGSARRADRGRRSAASLPKTEAAALLVEVVDAVVHTGDLRFHPLQQIRWLEGQLAAARTVKNREAEGAALGNLGLAYAALGDARKAIEFYEQQLVIVRELGDRRGEGNALGNFGSAYAALGDARKAIEFYNQHLDIARELGDRRGEGNTLGNLGSAYYYLGDARKAIEFYEQHLDIARELGDRYGEGNALCGLGSVHYYLGDVRKAIKFYEQQLVIVREIGDRRGEGIVFGNLGFACAALGDARKAIEFYNQALEIAREIGDRCNEGNWLGDLGLAYADMGDARKAIEFHEQALVIAREIGDRRGEGNALGNLGLAYYTLDDARKAIEFYEQCLRLHREIGDRRGEGNALFNFAVAFNELGERAQAVTRAEAALKIFEAIEDPHAAKVRAKLVEWRGK